MPHGIMPDSARQEGSATTYGLINTIADLPAPGTKRWVIRRKAEVVAAVRGGLLSLEEACSRYMLTVEEFLAWQRSIDRHGLAGLRTTRLQKYRSVVPDADVPFVRRLAQRPLVRDR
jgi:hypothetical protein